MAVRSVLWSLLFLTLAVTAAGAQSFLEWKGLDPGPHAVGFRSTTVEDLTRTLGAPTDYLGRPRQGYGRRPLHVAVWYPAEPKTSGHPMTYGDYLPLLAWDTGPEAEGAQARQVAELQYIQMVTPQAGPPDSAAIDRLKRAPVWARRDATPAPGRYPVLLYAPGSGYPAFDNSVLFEFLAGHGYVVVSAPSTGPDGGRMPGNAFGLDAQVRDLEFLAGFVQALPQADTERIGTAGFSWGGLSSVLFALRHARVKAVISLDGTIRQEQSLAIARTFPHFRPERLRVPLLVFTTTPDLAIPSFVDESFLEQARYTEITRAVVSGTVHHDLASMSSLLRRAAQGGTGQDWTAANAGYQAVCKMTLSYLDTHLKNSKAAEFLSDPAVTGVCKISIRMAQKAPPAPEDFLEILAADGLPAAVNMVRTMAKERPGSALAFEGAINQVGYTLLGAGRVADAIAVLALGVEISPESVNASDSLGEAYLAAGELDRAEACYLDARRKLDQVKDLSPDAKTRYVASVDRALAEIARRRTR